MVFILARDNGHISHFSTSYTSFMNILYPKNLPITSRKDDILRALKNHQVIVVAGDTGSGKTTQIAKMCLEAFPENKLIIGCTQPRRIAASTVASRVSEELGKYGNIVGYKIRFHDHTTRSTKIKYMTDGVLLAETKRDRLLSQYGVLIIDEAHERSLNIDFLLGYLKRLLPKRPDLKIIITSATIDTQAFSRHFNNAPVLTISGRTYPVTVRYSPIDEKLLEDKGSLIDHCVQTIADIFYSEARGDILVFLPTERDIRECCIRLEKRLDNAVILPMFGRLQAADQKRIFQHFKEIKIVVATNVAETSVTVPGIRYVIDTGLARISHYNARSQITRLPVSKVSRASCDQRKGRCGRIGPGVCIRLYSEEDYETRSEYTLPELQRSNLAEVILQMISLNLGNPTQFPFIDPPHGSAIREGYRLLRELGAIGPDMTLTEYGKIMSELPIDPCISRIILAALENNCLKEIKIIGSVLAIQDPRIRPADCEIEADGAHKHFTHPQSDFMALLNIWNDFHKSNGKVRSWSKLKKYCKSYFLSFQRMREWLDLHEQLERILSKRKGFAVTDAAGSYEQIHKSLLTGFLRNIGMKRQNKIYQGTFNKELMIFPGSHQFNKGGRWIVAATFIETNRLYGLTVATIEPEWIESVAKHLCRYSYSNPRWHKKNGQVLADESVSLFTLQIVVGRKVNFGKCHKKNIKEARDIFIQSALVRGEIKGTYHFLQQNLSLVARWEETENKLRTRGIVADDLVLHDFYDRRIPPDVFDQRTLNSFLRKRRHKKFLVMKDQDVLLRKPEDHELTDYPPSLNIGALEIRLEYNFVPGSENDGVTFHLPIDFAQTVSLHIFYWLVPGLLREKLLFLLKGLPKNIRKQLVPVAHSVDQILDDITPYSGFFFEAIQSSILKQFKLLVRRSDWPADLPLHLQPRFILFDSSGKEQGTGRNLELLLKGKKNLEIERSVGVLTEEDQKIIDFWQKRVFTTWDFQGLPAIIPLRTRQGDGAGFLYPALKPDIDHKHVKIHFEKNLKRAENFNNQGMLFLYRIPFSNHYKSLKKICTTTLSAPSAHWLFVGGLNRQQTTTLLLNFIMRSIFSCSSGMIEPLQMFDKKIRQVQKDGFYKNGVAILSDFMTLLRKRKEVKELINKICRDNSEKKFKQLVDEIVYADFLSNGQHNDIEKMQRQLHSLSVRLERFSNNSAKDANKEKQLTPHLNNLKILDKRAEQLSPDALESYNIYRDMIAEFRISIFSPELKTRIPVSSKKLLQQYQSIMEKY